MLICIFYLKLNKNLNFKIKIEPFNFRVVIFIISCFIFDEQPVIVNYFKIVCLHVQMNNLDVVTTILLLHMVQTKKVVVCTPNMVAVPIIYYQLMDPIYKVNFQTLIIFICWMHIL
jgi:hypothetical protein